MIFRIRSPEGIFGQSMSDLRNGSLTGVSRSLESAILKNGKRDYANTIMLIIFLFSITQLMD